MFSAVRVVAVPAACAVVLAACTSADDLTTVPSNASLSLGTAVERLREAGLRFEIEAFPRQPAGVGLEGYFVRSQSPRAPARVPRGTVVELLIHSSPIPSPAFRTEHPPTLVVPRLVGLPYTQAVDRVPEGLWIQLGPVPPLRAELSARGLDAFVVERQSPRGGAVVAYGCGAGCRPSTVLIELAPSAEG